MAACSVFHSYPSSTSGISQYPPVSTMNESRGDYIRDEIIFSMPRCSTPLSLREDRESSGGTLPRLRGETASAPVDRRASMLQEYFKSTNALNRSIMLEKSTVENSHGHSWNGLSDSKRDEIVNEHFVPTEVRHQYDERGLLQTRSLNRFHSTPHHTFLSQDEYGGHDEVDHEMVSITLSQPSSAAENRFQSQRRPSQPSELSRTNLMSFSFRSKKISPISSRRKVEEDFLPLFERDVQDEIDLPDESLINDHVNTPGGTSEEGFTRLRPLRYSFGHKLRHRVDQTSSTDLTVISNMNVDSPSLQDLTTASTLDLMEHSTNTSPDLSTDPHVLLASPMSDDTMSIVSSRHSLSTPEPSSNIIRGKPSRLSDSPFKHPLTRSTRAGGSTYVTVTSDFADRRHIFKAQQMKRKTKSENNTRENTPIPSETDIEKKLIPVIKTDSVINNMYTTTELVSPSCSPPISPAAHYPSGKRESGYISSYGENEASDDEEVSHRSNNSQKPKKKNNRVMTTESTNRYMKRL